MDRKLVTKKDLILLIFIILACALVFFYFNFLKQDGEKAIISVNGQTVEEIDLASVKDEKILTLENGVKIKAQNGAICFLESDCKDKICINSGALSKKGDVAVCVPNKTVISIEGAPEEFDVLTY